MLNGSFNSQLSLNDPPPRYFGPLSIDFSKSTDLSRPPTKISWKCEQTQGNLCSERFARRPNCASGGRANRLGRFNGCFDRRIGQRPIWLSVPPASRPAGIVHVSAGRFIGRAESKYSLSPGLIPNTSDTSYVIKVAKNEKGA